MKKVALINVTHNAISPITDYFSEHAPSLILTCYLDEGLMTLVNRENGVNDRSLMRFLSLLSKACEDGADAVLLTCTVFSPYVRRMRSLFSVPIVSVDSAMLEQAAAANKRTAFLCTFPSTVYSARQGFEDACVRMKVKPDYEFFLLREAYYAMQSGDRAEHDRLIAERAFSLQNQFEQIVLTQVSMAHVAERLGKLRVPLLTSPQSACKEVLRELKMNL